MGEMYINLVNFILLSLVMFGHSATSLEGGKVENKDHLSPAEAEIGAELGNIICNENCKALEEMQYKFILRHRLDAYTEALTKHICDQEESERQQGQEETLTQALQGLT